MLALKLDFANDRLDRITRAAPTNKVEKLENLITKGPDSLHFIPPLEGWYDMGLINFNNIKTVPVMDLLAADKVATINPAYMKDIQARFGQYFSKQGQPEIDVQHLVNTLFPSGLVATTTAQGVEIVSKGIATTIGKECGKRKKAR